MTEPKAYPCHHCDFGSGMRGGDSCGKCAGTGSVFRVEGGTFPNTKEGYEAAVRASTEHYPAREHRENQCPLCLAPTKNGLYHNDVLISETERANKAERELKALKEKANIGSSIMELQAEIGRLRAILHHKVCGDQSVGVSAMAPEGKFIVDEYGNIGWAIP